MSSRPPLAGFNHNVNYRHRQYHVQTEDSGTENPRIDTHLYQGGMIIESAKTDYSDLLEMPNSRAAIKTKMQTQHKGLMKMLIHGELDDKIVTYLGSLDPEDEFEAPILEQAEIAEDASEEATPVIEPEVAAEPEAAAAAAEAEAAAADYHEEVLEENVLDQVYAEAEAATPEEEDEVYTSMDGLDQMYQDLDESGADQTDSPEYQEPEGSSEEESFAFELSGGTADVPSVTKAIEEERKAALPAADWSASDPHKDEAFEVTLDSQKDLSLDEVRADTESTFEELDLEVRDSSERSQPAYAGEVPDQEPEPAAGSAADWLELDYPEDAIGGRYDLESASDDELFNAPGVEEGYGIEGAPAAHEDEVLDGYPTGESFSVDDPVSPAVSFDLFPGEGSDEDDQPDQGNEREMFSPVSEVTPATLSTELAAEMDAHEAALPEDEAGSSEPSFADSFTDLAEEESTSELGAVSAEEEFPEQYPEEPPAVATPPPAATSRPRAESQPSAAPQIQPPHSSRRVIRTRGTSSGYRKRTDAPEEQPVASRMSRDTIPVSTFPFDPEEPPDLIQSQAPVARDVRPTVREAQVPIPAKPRQGDTRTPAPMTPPPRPGPARQPTASLETRGLLERERHGHPSHQATPRSPSAMAYPIVGQQQGAGGKAPLEARPPRSADIPRTPSGQYPIAPVRGRPVGASTPGPSPTGKRPPVGPTAGAAARYPQASSPQRFTAPRRRSSGTTPAVNPPTQPPQPRSANSGRQAGVSRTTGTWRQQQGGGPQPTMRRVSAAEAAQRRQNAPPPPRAGVQVSQNVVIGQGRTNAPPPPRRSSRQPVQPPPAQPRRPAARPEQGNYLNDQAGSIQANSGQRRPVVPTRVQAPQAETGGERTLDEVILDYLNEQESGKVK